MRHVAAHLQRLLLLVAAALPAAAATPHAIDTSARHFDSMRAERQRPPGWYVSPGGLWATAGIATGASNITDEKNPPGLRLGLTLRLGVERYSIDWSHSAMKRYLVFPSERFDMVEITYGRAYEGRLGFVAIYGGLGYLSGTKRGRALSGSAGLTGEVHESIALSSLTIPVRVEACLVKGFGEPWEDELWWIGAASVYASANISKHGVVYFLGAAIHVGLF